MIWLRRPLTWSAALLLGSVLGLSLRLLLFLIATFEVQSVAGVAGVVLPLLPAVDPVYGHAAVTSLGDVHVQGLAIGGPLGSELHALLPALVVDPARAWLVYGANVYSPVRLQQIVAAWPGQWVGGPLVISEFAPGGVAPAERAVGFEHDWAIIRSRPDVVLGGLAYTWATNGPEQLDRLFGLVDSQAVPTDGALAALSASYLADLAQTAGGAPPN